MMLRVFALMALCLMVSPALAQTTEPSPILSVSGTGTVSLAPDMVTIHVGVETEAETAAEALAQNSAAAASVIAALKASDVDSRNIQTSGFSVSPIYNDRKALSSGEPRVNGYRVTNQVVARSRDLDGLGGLLDRLVQDGANRINGISFGVENDSEALDTARTRAVEDAVRKAEIYAKAADVTLGPILSISEGGGHGPSVRGGVAFAMADRSAAPIERGETTLSAQVSITWSLAD